jgi:HlyD family secretion protein
MMQLKKEPEKNADQSETFKLNITNARRRRMFLWLFILVFVVSVLTYLLQPKAIVVDLHEVKKEALIVSIDEEGQTQVRDIYTFSAPVAGKLDRINLKVGDTVKAYETPIVVIHPSSPAYLDIRSEKQAQVGT